MSSPRLLDVLLLLLIVSEPEQLPSPKLHLGVDRIGLHERFVFERPPVILHFSSRRFLMTYRAGTTILRRDGAFGGGEDQLRCLRIT